MIGRNFLIIIIMQFLTIGILCNAYSEDRINKSLEELAALDGYKVEPHKIISEDGYVLIGQRISSTRNSTLKHKNPIMFLIGMCASSECYVVMGNLSIPYVLVENGYDVWIMNPRGNEYSNRHLKWDSTKDREYWNFTLFEMAYYDVPASIDYILNVTNTKSLSVIGHSQGSTIMFMALAARVEYNDKVNLGVHLAPSLYVNETDTPLLLFLKKHVHTLEHLTIDFFNIHFVPHIKGTLKGINEACNLSPGIKSICELVLKFIDYGVDFKEYYDNEAILTALGHAPSGCSTKVLFHYAQFYASGKLQQYDYQLRGNLREYGTPEPPAYYVSNITSPMALFYHPLDFILPAKGINRLVNELQKPIRFEIQDKNFRHITYLISKLVGIIIPDLLKILEKYNH
ncbi:lipase 3 [Aethina tumida]|uniref:lipase 3 n=1 Tax=Aethina tumida TaxID=116153 RepID=UPI00096B18AE|nr:lipase 3 [Aethina tumida]